VSRPPAPFSHFNPPARTIANKPPDITPKVHVYSIPPNTISTTAGYAAASWTAAPQNPIFTARLRVLETSYTSPTTPVSPDEEETPPTINVAILLEDPSSGSLFAAAPYTSQATVEPTTDSSRFFALRVQDPTGKQKATLGAGFEERSEAFDLSVALQEAGKALGWFGTQTQGGQGGSNNKKKTTTTTMVGDGWGDGGGGGVKRDLSLKEGETITVNLKGTRFGRRQPAAGEGGKNEGEEEGGKSLASFSLAPPPPPSSSGGNVVGGVSAREARAQKRLSAQQLGFDDGQFGEFA
jgi:hypothetical protein